MFIIITLINPVKGIFVGSRFLLSFIPIKPFVLAPVTLFYGLWQTDKIASENLMKGALASLTVIGLLVPIISKGGIYEKRNNIYNYLFPKDLFSEATQRNIEGFINPTLVGLIKQ